MFDVLHKKPSIVQEAKKARFQPIFILQLIIFIAVFLVTQLAASLPTLIVSLIKMISDISNNKVNLQDPTALNQDYVTGLTDSLMILALFSTVIATALTIVYVRFIEKRSLYSMGFVKKNAFRDYIIGLFVGAIMFAASVLLAWLSGSLEYKAVILGNSLGLVIVFFFGFILQGMSEEVILRGYLMVSIATKKPIILAILANSVLFALIHIFNNGITVLSLINLTLFGVFASLYALRSDSIWGICAIHSTWNFTQGNVFGISVSGIQVEASILSFIPTNTNTIMNGGSFGLEGGLAVTIVLVIGIVVNLLLKSKNVQKTQVPEMDIGITKIL